MGTAPAFASVGEAMEMVRAGLAFVAATDATELTTEERANSVLTVARTSVLGAFGAARGYAADADYSLRAWLMHQTSITRGAAVACTAWVKQADRHPEMFAAMAAEEGLSESYARTLSTWTDKLRPASGMRPTRSWPPRPGRGWDCGTWPSSPPRSWPGAARTSRMRTRARISMTGR
jgi:hypothetical protein